MEDIQLLKVDKAMEELETREDWSDGEDSSTKVDDSREVLGNSIPVENTIEGTGSNFYNESEMTNESEAEAENKLNDEDVETKVTDPIEFNNLNVPANVRELFHYITKYRPQILEMETKLKPFLPDFIPAVGDPDAFLKIDRPDGNSEIFGLTVIDEPSLNQSDPSVLDLRLRSIYKRSSAKTMIARTIEEGNKSKAVEKWIKDINELHRTKPLPTVSYYKQLPDIDTLLQEWNSEVEELICEEGFLPSDLDCSVLDYIKLACGLFDIPVYSGHLIHSLYLLLTVYAEMGRLEK